MQEAIMIALAPGQAGFYDELTGIHLNLSNKEAHVPATANTMGLVNAVKAGKIIVVSGFLNLETVDYVEARNVPPSFYRLLDDNEKKIVNISNIAVEMIEQNSLNQPEPSAFNISLTEDVSPQAINVVEEEVKVVEIEQEKTVEIIETVETVEAIEFAPSAETEVQTLKADNKKKKTVKKKSSSKEV